MFRFLYNLLFPIALVLVLPGYLAKLRRRGNYRHKFWQRFGIYDREVRARLATGRCVWLHAVSVGEVAVALKLAEKWREDDASLRCVLTTTTTTGFAFAGQIERDWIEVMYNPIDWWPIMLHAFRVIRPAKVVLVEAEVWPNLVAIARSRRVPVALVNARLSRRSERRFRRFRFAVAPIFRQLDLVCVQEGADVSRWTALGVAAGRIHLVGSVKYDPEIAAATEGDAQSVLRKLRVADDQPILLGGSTHDGEEALLAEVYEQLRKEFPTLFLIIAPRHVERTAEICEVLERRGLSLSLRTEVREEPERPPDCLLLNTTGELRAWYRVATVVFIGKSVTGRGGQNPVEAILAGRPVLFGPHMENFAALASALLAHGGALEVAGAAELCGAAAALLRDESARLELVTRAGEVIAAHAGATARTVSLLTEVAAH